MLIPDQVALNTLHDFDEGKRLRNLSNADLVREHQSISDDEDDELYIIEFWTRLYPGWAGEGEGH